MKIYAVIVLVVINSFALTLKEAYDSALPGNGYDKLLILEKGKVYKGGLFLGKFLNPVTLLFEPAYEKSVCIKGNGAILDLMNGQIHIAYTKHKLDIDSCVIMNGTLRYNGYPEEGNYIIPFGSVKNVTFYNAIDYCVRMEGAGENMDIGKNLVVNCLTTGPDFNQYHSTPSEKMITGSSFAFSIFSWYGMPRIIDNWSYNPGSHHGSLNDFSML